MRDPRPAAPMSRWGTSSALSATAASLLSMAVLLWFGRRESTPAAPLNAVSHWVHGDSALRRDRPSVRHTGLGVLIHSASSVFWAVAYEVAVLRRRRRVPLGELAVGAAATTAVAALVDLKLVPERLTPGFEHRLSRTGLVATYAAFGAGLLLAAAALRGRR